MLIENELQLHCVHIYFLHTIYTISNSPLYLGEYNAATYLCLYVEPICHQQLLQYVL